MVSFSFVWFFKREFRVSLKEQKRVERMARKRVNARKRVSAQARCAAASAASAPARYTEGG